MKTKTQVEAKWVRSLEKSKAMPLSYIHWKKPTTTTFCIVAIFFCHRRSQGGLPSKLTQCPTSSLMGLRKIKVGSFFPLTQIDVHAKKRKVGGVQKCILLPSPPPTRNPSLDESDKLDSVFREEGMAEKKITLSDQVQNSETPMREMGSILFILAARARVHLKVHKN
ncbi:hypothetical protein HNY73_013382 [Argiope bruennichi]|uniref:Uncharacterized protein n=1 Tax=Argiope bruennichi TaxID=94029 RepID=A0A8T0EXT9_ARGBR|nr:hypothetical protein HNY73_013382 [Argiope bruennichi]